MATKVATTLQTASSATAAANARVGGSSNTNSSITMLENQHPSKSAIAGSSKLITYYGGNVNNNSIAPEKYYIRPSFIGLLKCPGVQSGIWYFPIPNSIYALKFYYPDENDAQYYNMMYCIPAKQNKQYYTGYQDYTIAIPPEFVAAFTKFASTLPKNIKDYSSSTPPVAANSINFKSANETQKLTFSFNFYGSLSGVKGKGSMLSFTFAFYPGQPAI